MNTTLLQQLTENLHLGEELLFVRHVIAIGSGKLELEIHRTNSVNGKVFSAAAAVGCDSTDGDIARCLQDMATGLREKTTDDH